MKCALSAHIVRNREKPWKKSQNFVVELGASGILGLAVNREDLPPHKSRDIERVSRLLVQMRQMRRTPYGHDLLEERDK
jgi:hypothetical protein